jgi:hypothetical protein
MRLATIDVESGQIREINAFNGAKHINPQFAADGRSIYFIANPEGIPDIYRITWPEGQINRVTMVDSGVAGITDMSPALTVASRSGDIAFSLYEDDHYNIYSLPAGTVGAPAPVPDAPAENTAPRAALPPLRGDGLGDHGVSDAAGRRSAAGIHAVPGAQLQRGLAPRLPRTSDARRGHQ